MPQLHLNIYDAHGDAPDEEGADYTDVSAAEIAAYAGIRSLLSKEVLDGELNLIGRCEIVDNGGNLLTVISFEQALKIVRKES